MSNRYGSRAQSSALVSNWGRAISGGGGSGFSAYYEQEFTAPGVWTNPGTVESVVVFAVGGGGGGGVFSDPLNAAPGNGGAGGGGEVADWVPVGLPATDSLSILIGSGGAVGSPTTQGSNGGSTTIAPVLSPSTILLTAGGGGGGGTNNPLNIPIGYGRQSLGGGGGGARGLPGGAGGTGRFGSKTGGRSFVDLVATKLVGGGGGGASSPAFSAFQGISTSQSLTTAGGYGIDGFGGGGSGNFSANPSPPTTYVNFVYLRHRIDGGGCASTPAAPNSGGGGGGAFSDLGTKTNGTPGGSGYLIIGWYE